jgi:hypothetical protein
MDGSTPRMLVPYPACMDQVQGYEVWQTKPATVIDTMESTAGENNIGTMDARISIVASTISVTCSNNGAYTPEMARECSFAEAMNGKGTIKSKPADTGYAARDTDSAQAIAWWSTAGTEQRGKADNLFTQPNWKDGPRIATEIADWHTIDKDKKVVWTKAIPGLPSNPASTLKVVVVYTDVIRGHVKDPPDAPQTIGYWGAHYNSSEQMWIWDPPFPLQGGNTEKYDARVMYIYSVIDPADPVQGLLDDVTSGERHYYLQHRDQDKKTPFNEDTGYDIRYDSDGTRP